MHPEKDAKDLMAEAKHAEEMVAWEAKRAPINAKKMAEKAENEKKYDWKTGDKLTANQPVPANQG
jgi:hypothetical protein